MLEHASGGDMAWTKANHIGSRPSINIHQSWMRNFAIFSARAAQRRCPIASNLG